jgi:hypothetical protein
MGTIHSDDPRVTRLKPEVIRALDASDRFVMEMKLDTGALMQFGSAMAITDGDDLEGLLGTRLFRKTATAMAAKGMPEAVTRRLKPWAVMVLLSTPPSTGGTILDMVLHGRANERGIPTAGLESAGEQLAVFNGLAMSDQIALLKATLDQLPSLPAMFERLIAAYAAGNLTAITRLGRESVSGASGPTARRFMQRLNEDRNHRMAERIVAYLQQGNSFIAVGSLHLAGPDGLLAILESRGYLTEAVNQ